MVTVWLPAERFMAFVWPALLPTQLYAAVLLLITLGQPLSTLIATDGPLFSPAMRIHGRYMPVLAMETVYVAALAPLTLMLQLSVDWSGFLLLGDCFCV